MKRKHGFLLFLSTCLPGCGQMYQGYMKRGLSLALVFWGILALSIFLRVGELAIFLPLSWLYTFFDSYNLRGQSDEEAAANPDAYLFGLSALDQNKLAALCRKRHSLLGWVLVILGLYLLYRTVGGWIINVLSIRYDVWLLQNLLMYDVPRVLATILVIGLGVWFIRGPRKKAPPADDDIPTFTPPDPPAGSGQGPADASARPSSEEEEGYHGEQ